MQFPAPPRGCATIVLLKDVGPLSVRAKFAPLAAPPVVWLPASVEKITVELLPGSRRSIPPPTGELFPAIVLVWTSRIPASKVAIPPPAMIEESLVRFPAATLLPEIVLLLTRSRPWRLMMPPPRSNCGRASSSPSPP